MPISLVDEMSDRQADGPDGSGGQAMMTLKTNFFVSRLQWVKMIKPSAQIAPELLSSYWFPPDTEISCHHACQLWIIPVPVVLFPIMLEICRDIGRLERCVRKMVIFCNGRNKPNWLRLDITVKKSTSSIFYGKMHRCCWQNLVLLDA